MRLNRQRVIVGVLVFMAACSAAGFIAGPVPTGIWGGTQGNLTVYADSATVDLPCSAGRIQAALTAGADGTFDVSGFYAPVVGPVQVGGPSWQPAQYHGSRTTDVITLTIQTSNNVTIGSLQFHRGTNGNFARCL